MLTTVLFQKYHAGKCIYKTFQGPKHTNNCLHNGHRQYALSWTTYIHITLTSNFVNGPKFLIIAQSLFIA